MVKSAYNKKHTYFWFCDTGTGKTFSSLMLAKQNPKYVFLILVHVTDAVKTWEDDSIKFFGELLPNVIIKPYTVKLDNIKHDILIIDEIHKLKGMGVKFINVFRQLEYDKLIGLTATPIDSLNDVMFYMLILNVNFINELKLTKGDIKASKKIINDYKKDIVKHYKPVYEKEKFYSDNGNFTWKKKITHFSNKEFYIKQMLKRNSVFFKNYEVIDDVIKFGIEDFKIINIYKNKSLIRKEIEKEKERRIEINRNNFEAAIEFAKAKDVYQNASKILQQEKDKEIKDKELIFKLSEMKNINKKIMDQALKNFYPNINPSNKWINDMENKLFNINELKLKEIKEKQIIVTFFKNSKSFLMENLDCATLNPREFIKGKYKYLITNASTIAEGMNGLQQQTNSILFWDFQQSRMTVEQLIGRINRTGMVDKPEVFIFYDNGNEEKMWENVKNKITLHEWLKY